MATVYVDTTDAYLDQVVYNVNDTITVRYGATLTIRQSNTTQPFQITTADSVIKITTAERKLVLAAGGYVNCVAGDIGKTVVGATTGDTGTLVDYDNATRTWHVLRTDPLDDQFDNAVENISITGGTGAGAMSAAADQYIILKFNGTNNSGLVPTGTAKVLIEVPDWYSLGTGNGAADQTFAFFGAEACPWVQVENDALDETYTDCRCIYDTAFSAYGAGTILGNVFQHAPDAGAPIANITFHDGVNGLKPANGANVRCKPLYITSAMAYTATLTNRSRMYTSYGATYDVEGALFSDRFYLNLQQSPETILKYVGTFSTMTLTEDYSCDMDYLIVAKDRAVGSLNALICTNCSGTFNHVHTESYNPASTTSQSLRFIQCENILFENSSVYVTIRASGGYGLNFSYGLGNIVNNVNIVGHYAYFAYQTNLKITDLYNSDTPTGVKTALVPFYLLTLATCSVVVVDGVEKISGGSAPYLSLIYLANLCTNVVIKNVTYDLDSQAAYAFTLVSTCYDISIANCTFTNAPRTGYVSLDNTSKRVSFRNIVTPAAYGFSAPLELRVEGVSSASPTTTHTSEFDAPYQLIYADATKATGYICLIMTPEKELEYFNILAGDPDASIYFNNSGALYMKTDNDQCTFEIPYLIQGVDSFVNAAPTILHADFATKVDQEYSIKSGAYGSAWGAWTPVTGANLAAEVVDSVVGFYMKFRFTTNTTGATNNYCTRYMLSVNTDAAFTFPVGYVPITLTGMVSGSFYWVHDDTNNRVLAQGTAAGVDVVFDAPYEFDSTDVTITVRVRKGSAATKYIPFETTVTYDENGAIVYISQIEDTIAA